MQNARSSARGRSCTVERPIRVLVISQHEVVRCQLVAYLGRSSSLCVTGDEFSPDAIEQARPDVLVLDLSRIGPDDLHQAIDAVTRSGGKLIALASLRVPADEAAVLAVGGLYRLKSAGADGLAEVVSAVRPRSG